MTVGIALLFGWLEIIISQSLRKMFAWLLGRIVFSVLETGPFYGSVSEWSGFTGHRLLAKVCLLLALVSQTGFCLQAIGSGLNQPCVLRVILCSLALSPLWNRLK